MSVDESIFFLLFQKKWHLVPFCCCRNSATAGHIGMQIFNFAVFKFAYCFHLMYVNLNLELMLKGARSLYKWGMEASYISSSLALIHITRSACPCIWMWFQKMMQWFLAKIQELISAQISLSECKFAWMHSKEPK